MLKALAQIRQLPAVPCAELCDDPANPRAKNFYQRSGFAKSAMDKENEDVLALLQF